MKYKFGDKVSFPLDDKIITGVLVIIDENGAFECNGPSYDIFSEKENMLYKHIEEKYIIENGEGL